MTKLGTRKLLAETLKKLLREKDISKISVSELTEAAGINRKTFYYHFRDVYELLAWTFETEAIAVVANFDLRTDYRQAISFVMDYLEANEYIVSKLARTSGRGGIRRFLHKDLFEVVQNSLEDIIPKDADIDEDYKIFVSEFLTEAIAGVLIHWAEDSSVRDRKKIEFYLNQICEALINSLTSYPLRKDSFASSRGVLPPRRLPKLD